MSSAEFTLWVSVILIIAGTGGLGLAIGKIWGQNEVLKHHRNIDKLIREEHDELDGGDL